MAVTYSSAALIKTALKWTPPGLVDPTDFDNYIYSAESIIDENMGISGRGAGSNFTYNAKQHGIIQRCATAISAFFSITYNVSSFPLLEEMEITANLLYYDQLRALTLLSNKHVADFLAAFSSTISNTTYSSPALVKKAAKYVPSALSDADIEVFIFQAESLVDSVIRKTGRGDAPDFTFAATTKHGLIQRATTAIATFYAISSDPGFHPILESAEATCNLLYYSQLRDLTLLADTRTVDHLVNL